MAMQRNNLARLPYEIREIAYRMRFNGAGNLAIAEAVQTACKAAAIPVPKIHGTTLVAMVRRDKDYALYCDRRRRFDERMAPKRWSAGLINDGRGPQTVADVAMMEAAEGLAETLQVDGMEPSERVKVTRALTDLQRTLLARQRQDADARLKEIEEQHAAAVEQLRHEIAGRDQAIADLRAECERLRNPSLADQAAGLSDAEKAAKIRERLGIG